MNDYYTFSCTLIVAVHSTFRVGYIIIPRCLSVSGAELWSGYGHVDQAAETAAGTSRVHASQRHEDRRKKAQTGAGKLAFIKQMHQVILSSSLSS